MGLIDLIAGFGGWSWVVIGLGLLGIELLVPGGVFIWFGVAAVLVGLIALQFTMSWPVQILVFLGLSFGSVFVWRAYRKANPNNSDQPFLNQRVHRYLGQAHVLAEDVVGGEGQLVLDETIWRIRANQTDVAAGTSVRIVGAEGAVLLVEVS